MSSETAVRLSAQVRRALQEHRCFEALFDKVLDVRKAVFGDLEELFDLPLQTKKRIVFKNLFIGYYGSTIPLYESMIIDDANIAENFEQRLTSILWPEGNTRFSSAFGSKSLLSFSELASGLEKTIRIMILESFGVEKYMDEHMDSANYILWVMKYEGPQTSEATLGSRAHSDQNMVTLLYQNEVNGLEIHTQDGDWISVKPSSDTSIVMIGESFSVSHFNMNISFLESTNGGENYCF
ncbi:probable 2-oxoglutarate-dependent dioxygenase AOP1 [Durio zibethinus]|uniref:Probable 2-oxoglutarate-dependent dioxygenase AOP1 n=1 Tax=Durio zibethinus TaxID=66656 RepID=A0A6P5X5W7_DURZI|nr:probable 2-oxoglutarate-dependent dioxygenase AOP1 [Durio zibethinus]